MSKIPPKLFPLGDAAATLRFGETIDAALHGQVMDFCAALERSGETAILEWAPAFASVTLWYDPDALPFAELEDFCARLTAAPAPARAKNLRQLPFCAEGDFAPDLADVARHSGLTPQDWLARFRDVTFEVYMLGFLPGFAYLGGLPREIDAPRLKTPRKIVPERSVAVADGMCAAYPFASPGGWRLIGRTPIEMFDARQDNPVLLAPGDLVRWRPISMAEFLATEAQWRG